MLNDDGDTFEISFTPSYLLISTKKSTAVLMLVDGEKCSLGCEALRWKVPFPSLVSSPHFLLVNLCSWHLPFPGVYLGIRF